MRAAACAIGVDRGKSAMRCTAPSRDRKLGLTVRALVAVTAVVAGCGGGMSEQAALSAMKLLPATLDASHLKAGPPRVVQVRIYADDKVRALPHWKEDITEQVDYASQ